MLQQAQLHQAPLQLKSQIHQDLASQATRVKTVVQIRATAETMGSVMSVKAVRRLPATTVPRRLVESEGMRLEMDSY